MDLPRVPDNGRASERVFRRLYRVRVPRSLTMSKAEIELYGRRMTGIADLDKYLANELVTGRIPTTRMAQIIWDGGSIQFCDIFDTKQCYLDLYQHVLNWRYILETNYNVKYPPEEDFEKLQALLDALEAYSGVLDRGDKNAIASPLSLLNVSNSRRKAPTQRIPTVQVPEKGIEIVELTSYDQLQNFTRR